jgi:glycosyltransferase involved in cell wall biosynthesis
MAMVLTSSHSCYAKRAVDSIINQKSVDFEYDVFVNVNTLTPGYYEEIVECMKNYPGITVIQTESNGSPGKGHNACLEIFKNHPEYDYLTFIDGDDLFFPVAFQQYEKLLTKRPGLDVAHLMINDNITVREKDHQNIKLHGKFYLYTAANSQANWWKHLDIGNPYSKPLMECRTPSRLILASRRIFDSPIKIEYSEKCKLYDDYRAFLTIVDAEKHAYLNTCALSDPTIYCYNAENDSGATLNFGAKYHAREQEIFNEECMQYTALQESWEYLKELPYEFLEKSNEFDITERVKFCNEFFVMFEIRDRVKHAQECLVAGNALGARTFYERAIEGGAQSNTIDMNLGICQYKTGQLDNAIDSFQKILLKENKVEAHSHLATIYFQQKEYKLACNHALCGLKLDRGSKHLQHIFNDAKTKVNSIHVKLIEKKKSVDKPIMCFYTGYSDPFNGKNYQDRSVYGSEIAAVHVAEKMTKYYNVFVFCPCKPEDEIVYNDVTYIHLNKFEAFHRQIHINVMIVSRFIHFFYMFRINADKTYIWVHDARTHDFYQGHQFGELGKHFFNNIVGNVDGIICVSDWHCKYFKQWSNISEKYYHKIHVIGNSIDLEYFPKTVQKKKNRFVYCSDPSRGLDVLLKCWPQIKEKHSDATLDIYFSKLDDTMTKLVNKLPGVKFNGKIPEKQLCKELCNSDVFFYPNRSHETFGIVALQALAAGTVVVARRYSGLITTIGAGGKLISGNVDSEVWQTRAVNYINSVLDNSELKQTIQDNARNYGRRSTWDTRAGEWFRLLKNESV